MNYQANIVILGMEGDIPWQITNLLFLFPPLAKAVYDVFYTEAKYFPVIHLQSLIYAVVVGTMLAIIDWLTGDVKYFAQSAFLSAAIFWFIFDPLRNKFARKKLLYMDIVDTDPGIEDSWVDTHIYARLPSGLAWLWIKFCVVLAAFSVYYFFDYI